jgi:probable F420-dependent oxidoreductase
VSGTAHAFGALGAWLPRTTPAEVLAGLAPELEDLGYTTVWISGGREPGVFGAVDTVLRSTRNVTVATGVVNMWAETPESVTTAWHRIEAESPGRLFVGLGISHAPLIDKDGPPRYSDPLARSSAFLDGLDAQPSPLPRERRLLGALGPRMLRLARERTLGSHPYLVTADNTAAARGVLGDAFLAPEIGVVLAADRTSSRQLARESLARYFALPNYTRNWLRAGFTDDDLADGGSDRLIDALVAHGDLEAVAGRIAEHRVAGADHVALQVLDPAADLPATFRALSALI